MQVPDNAAGKTVRCPVCQKPFAVPAAAETNGPAANTAAKVDTTASKPSTSAPAPAPASGQPSTQVCPSCGSALLPGAIACMDCGFCSRAMARAAEPEGPPNLCTNPACGVANPPGERNCQRCGNPLPTAAGTVLHNRYRLDKLLKMGGFGAVYKATDIKANNREVAIKDMIGNDPQEFAIRLNFFRREAEILRSLEVVPIVPRVYDFIHQGQTAHLVMEFIRGKDLLDLMEASNNRPFPVASVIEWGKSICDVLDHMHRQSPPLIHRDLKPDNIMLLEDQRSIKMIDFGTARDLGRTAQGTHGRQDHESTPKAMRRRSKSSASPSRAAICSRWPPRSTTWRPAKRRRASTPPRSWKSSWPIRKSPLPEKQRWFFELLKINLSEDVNDRYFSAERSRKTWNARW